MPFENYVNYAGSKTPSSSRNGANLFENYVNYAGSKTERRMRRLRTRLRTM